MDSPEQNLHNAIFGETSKESEDFPTPTIQKDIDWSNVIKQAEDIRDEVVNGEYHEDNDNDHYLYEAVMEAVFGKDFFKWFNKNS